MQMKLDGERCQFQIATERLESATKAEKGGKLAEILQAKGEVETPNAMIETLIAEILQVYSSAPLSYPSTPETGSPVNIPSF